MAGEYLIKDYGGLIEALAERRRDLGMSQVDVDERAGFCDRYMSKVEAWQGKHGRGLGVLTLPLLLETLGVRLQLVTVEGAPVVRKAKLKRKLHRLRVKPGQKILDMRLSINKHRRRA